MNINARINSNTVEFEVQTNREDLTKEDVERLNEIVNNAMNGNHEENEGFSVSFNGRTFDTYQFDIKSDDFGDDLHSAFEKEREDYDKALDQAEFESFANEQKALEALNEDLDKALAEFDKSDNDNSWGSEVTDSFESGMKEVAAEQTVEVEYGMER